MTAVINLALKQWLDLCGLAERLADRPDDDGSPMLVAVGRLTNVSAHDTRDPYANSLAVSFRWDCNAYALGGWPERSVMAAGLKAKAALVRHLLTPEPEKGSVALPVPAAADNVETLPLWTRRADVGG